MMEAGLPDEAKALSAFKDLNALQTVGYAEMFEYFAGTMTLPEAVEQIKTHTRQYAKRQMTWFRKDATINWFEPGELKKMITYIELAREAQPQ
jgi:tRNA dimethylallyltransferase